jgi:hypothetical protein
MCVEGTQPKFVLKLNIAIFIHRIYKKKQFFKKDAIKMMKEKPEDDPPIDYNEFYENIWPALVRRVPSFQNAKVRINKFIN